MRRRGPPPRPSGNRSGCELIASGGAFIRRQEAFVRALADISTELRAEPRATRDSLLRSHLQRLALQLPSGVYMPLASSCGLRRHRPVRPLSLLLSLFLLSFSLPLSLPPSLSVSPHSLTVSRTLQFPYGLCMQLSDGDLFPTIKPDSSPSEASLLLQDGLGAGVAAEVGCGRGKSPIRGKRLGCLLPDRTVCLFVCVCVRWWRLCGRRRGCCRRTTRRHTWSSWSL